MCNDHYLYPSFTERNPQSSLMRGLGAGSRIFEILDRKAAIPHNTGVVLSSTRRGSIKFEDIRFEYPSRKGVDILKGFNLEMSVGESVAIVGSSGSGKSSVQSLLLRYYDPVHGKVTFDGQGKLHSCHVMLRFCSPHCSQISVISLSPLGEMLSDLYPKTQSYSPVLSRPTLLLAVLKLPEKKSRNRHVWQTASLYGGCLKDLILPVRSHSSTLSSL
jgi:ABC-type antimicrobial peptide transport system ATPase subunit